MFSKRFTALLLMLVMLFSLAACDTAAGDDTDNDTDRADIAQLEVTDFTDSDAGQEEFIQTVDITPGGTDVPDTTGTPDDDAFLPPMQRMYDKSGIDLNYSYENRIILPGGEILFTIAYSKTQDAGLDQASRKRYSEIVKYSADGSVLLRKDTTDLFGSVWNMIPAIDRATGKAYVFVFCSAYMDNDVLVPTITRIYEIKDDLSPDMVVERRFSDSDAIDGQEVDSLSKMILHNGFAYALNKYTQVIKIDLTTGQSVDIYNVEVSPDDPYVRDPQEDDRANAVNAISNIEIAKNGKLRMYGRTKVYEVDDNLNITTCVEIPDINTQFVWLLYEHRTSLLYSEDARWRSRPSPTGFIKYDNDEKYAYLSVNSNNSERQLADGQIERLTVIPEEPLFGVDFAEAMDQKYWFIVRYKVGDDGIFTEPQIIYNRYTKGQPGFSDSNKDNIIYLCSTDGKDFVKLFHGYFASYYPLNGTEIGEEEVLSAGCYTELFGGDYLGNVPRENNDRFYNFDSAYSLFKTSSLTHAKEISENNGVLFLLIYRLLPDTTDPDNIISVRELYKVDLSDMKTFTPALKDSGAEDSAKKTITAYAYFVNRTILDIVKGLFEKKYPAYALDITYFNQGDEDKMKLQLASEVMAGKGPDIFVMDKFTASDPYSMANAGNFANLGKYIDGDESFNPDDYYLNLLNMGIVDGKRYFVPMTVSPQFVYGDMDAIQKLGMVSKNGDTYTAPESYTIDEFMAQIQNQSDTPGYVKPQIQGDLAQFVGGQYLGGSGIQFYDLQTKQVFTDTDAFKTQLETFKKMYTQLDKVSIGKGQVITATDVTNMVMLDPVTMPSYYYYNYERLSDSTTILGIAEAPKAAEGLSDVIYPDLLLAVNSNSRNKQAAAEFVKLAISPEAVKAGLDGLSGYPVARSWVKDVVNYTKDKEISPELVDYFCQMSDAILSSARISFVNIDLEAIINDQLMKYLTDKQSLSDTCNMLAQKIQLFLAE